MRPDDATSSAPRAVPPHLDRTTLVVRLGLLVLTLTGLLTIFGEPLLLGPAASADLASPPR
jgi:hypothetical protein